MTELDQARRDCCNKPSKKNIKIYRLLERDAQMQCINEILSTNAIMAQADADTMRTRINEYNSLPWYKRIFNNP